MEMTVAQAQGRVPVTILRLQGDLDRSNYQDLIAKGRELFAAGARDLLLDMSATPYISSAGLVALHSLALLMRGDKPADPESGWEAIHAIDRDRDSGLQPHLKLLNPSPQVDRVLDKAGLKRFFEIHTEQGTAVASF